MKLYHATSKENASKIDVEGIKASNGIIYEGDKRYIRAVGFDLTPLKIDVTNIKGNEHKVPKFIYFATTPAGAMHYGDAVFEVDTDHLDQAKLGTYHEGIGLIHNHQGDIPPHLIKRLS